MSDCPCDNQREPGLETIPAGLDSLPRQQRAFPEVRRDLLAGVPEKTALGDWRAREEGDLGLMWLEMWAYVADVLNFYDERIANETYVRTAARRVSLRRIVELLGHFPKPGVAGSAAVAAIAEGRTGITLPLGTGFRSDGFDGEAPQVFENDAVELVHPLTNRWEIGPVRLSSTAPLETDELTFETASFGLAKDSLVLFEGPGTDDRRVSLVLSVTPFEGKDGVTYLRVKLRDTLTFAQGIAGVRVRTPSVVATVSPFESSPVQGFFNISDADAAAGRNAGFPVDDVTVTLNALYPQLRRDDVLIVARGFSKTSKFRKAYLVASVVAGSVSVNQQPLPVTLARLANAREDGLQNDPSQLTFHFALVDAGALITVGATEVSTSVLAGDQGVFIDGIQEVPPQAVNGELSQRFLLRDADDHGAAVGGRIVFQDDGRARFFLDDPLEVPFETLKTPITLFGNVIEASRGESVFNEVLGSGNPRILRQEFQLKKKPLTYLHAGASDVDTQVKSTLVVRVSGVEWREVKTFFGSGPDDAVYIVRHDEQQNTRVTFGDGVRGRRPPSGVNNIVANYRFGAGFAAPPEGAITQLAAAVKGLRGVESPVAATPGKDPEGPEELRTSAPKTALLLGRAVSPSDFEAIANTTPGVIRAQAQWLWLADIDGLDDRLEAGVHVFFIGDVDAASLKNTLLSQAEPTTPIAVTKATPIPVALELSIEVDPRFVQGDVASAVEQILTDPETGFLSLKKAQVGGVFFPSRLYDAVMEVEGVVGVSGASFTNLSGNGVIVPDRGSACIPTGTFLDFVEEGSVSVTGVAPIGPTPGTGTRRGAEKPSGPLPPSRLGESAPAGDEPTPDPAQDGFEQYYLEKLWALLPEIYRNEDGQGKNPGALRAIVEVIADDAARVRRSLDRLWEDQHAETADDWAVPYIGDLVSAPLSQVLDDRARRVITALAVNFRRRRGTPELLERLVRFIGGWDVAFVEAFLRLARTRHLLDGPPRATGRFTQTPPGGTANLRRPVGSEIASGPFGEYFHTPDFRPLRGRLGQFGVQRLNFHLFRLQAFHVSDVDPFELVPAAAGMIRYTFDPSGRDTQLFSFVAPDVATRDRASICRRPLEWEITGPIRCRLLGNAEFVISVSAVNVLAPPPTPPNAPSAARVALLKLLGIRFPDAGTLEARLEDLNAGLTPAEFIELLRLTMTDDSGRKNLYPQSVRLGEAEPEEFPREIVAAADLSDLECQTVPSLAIVDALIDPETGRFSIVPPAGPPDAPETVAYTYGFSDALGAGPYPRLPLPGLGPTQDVSGGGTATLSDNGTTIRGLTIEDSRTYTVTIQSGSTLRDAVLRANVGERPLLRLAGDAPDNAFGANLQPANGDPRRLVIEGVWLTSSDLEAELDPDEPARVVIQARTDATSESDWSEIVIRNATLDPGGTRADGVRIPPLVIEVEGSVDRLVIERSIVSAIVIKKSAGPNPTPLGRVQVLEIVDSIVDGQRYEAEGPDRVTIDNAFDDVILDRVTVFGDVRAERLFASDSIVFGRVRVVNNQDGCFRFSASSLGAGARLPPRFQDFPDLPAGIERPLEPSIFSSRTFGEPGYAQLSEAAPEEIARGAENGSEMGAFSSLLGPLRLDSVQNLVREFQPVGRLAQFLFEGDRGAPDHGEFGAVPPPVGPSTPFDPDPGAPIPVPEPPPPVLPTECPPPPDDGDDEEPPVPPGGAPFVVLGVQDADLNGAPGFWRGVDEGGNWRPGGTASTPASGSIGGIPFDKCDFVHEYDARFGTRPDVAGDNTQGTWAPQTVLSGHYEMTPGRGVLEVNVPNTAVSFWQRDVVTPAGRPENISAYAVFAIDDVTQDTEKDEGFDMSILANTGGDKFKGLRAVYHDPDVGDGGPAEFQYIKLDPPLLSNAHKNVTSGQPVDRIRRVWHKMSLQGKFTEANTITSLDERINYELLSFFGDSASSGPAQATFRARFGVVKTGSKALGRLRNFVASAPGRFIRAWFRAHTPVPDPVLNLYFFADPLPAGETATQAQFRVRYASTGTGFVPFSVPTNRKVFLVDATTAHRIVRVTVRLDTSGVESGSTTLPVLADRPLWFTIERTNNAASDPRRSTLYLVQAVLAPG